MISTTERHQYISDIALEFPLLTLNEMPIGTVNNEDMTD